MFIKRFKRIYLEFEKVFFYFPIIVIFVGYVLGILFGDLFPIIIYHVEFVLVISFLVFVISIFSHFSWLRSFLFLLSAFFLGVGQILIINNNSEFIRSESENIPLGQEVELTGIVREIDYSNDKTYLIIDVRDENVNYKGSARLKVSQKINDLIKDDLIEISAIYEMPENFDDFDYVKYLERKSVFLVGEVIDYSIIDRNKSFLSLVDNFRNFIIKKSRKFVSEPEVSLLLGLTIGYRADFDETFELALQKTGTTHIIAVSGYNVALLATIVAGLFQVFGSRISRLFVSLFLLFFCVLTDFNLPVIRAVFMFLIMSFARINGRDCSAFLGLCFASFLLILMNPFNLWSLSFQLSFFSTLGLIVGGNINLFEFEGSIADFLKDTLFSTWWAFLFTLPVIVYNFESFTFLTFLSNILVLPFVNLATVLGLIFIFLILLNNWIGHLFYFFVWPVLHFIYRIIDLVAQIPFGIVNINCDSWQLIILYYIVILVTINFLKFSNKYKKRPK